MSTVSSSFPAFDALYADASGVNKTSASGKKEYIAVTYTFTATEIGAQRNANGQLPPTVRLSEQQIERALFKKFGFDVNNETDLEQVKKLLQTKDSPFNAVRTTGEMTARLNSKTGKYELQAKIEKNLYRELQGKAAEVKTQINPQIDSGRTNDGENVAVKNGIERNPTNGVTIPLLENNSPTIKVRLVMDASQPVTADRALLGYVQNKYGGGNLWGDNIRNIRDAAKLQGVKVQNLKVTPMGDKRVVEFELSRADAAKVQQIYEAEQESVNRIQEISAKFANENEVSSFLRGVVNGAWGALKNTGEMLLDPIGTMKALWQVVSNPVETFEALKTQLGETWEEFKNADPSRKSEMVGELVGAAVVEILIGKGAGKALGVLGKTKAGMQIIDKANEVKGTLGKAVVNTFSDEAADAALKRIQQRLQTQLYSGIPADVLADMTVIAVNRIQKGAVKFADFARLMVQEFGTSVKPYLEKMYRDGMQALGKKVDDAEINNTNLNNIGTRQPITAANVSSVVVPGVRGGEFASWFNSLTKAEMDVLWTNGALRETVEARLRHPGGFHEWLPVSRAPKFREWGVTAEQIWELRSSTNNLRFVNPPGQHGGKGSPQAHRELFDLVERANNFSEFKTLIQQWAARRLPNGVDDLPAGLRR